MMPKEIKDFIINNWTAKDPALLRDSISEEASEIYDELADKYHNDFMAYKYTEAVDKEVEAIWLKRNSKLGRALK